MTSAIDYQVDNDGIVTLTIDVKDRSMNILTLAFNSELEQVVEQITKEDSIKGVIITSAKKDFIAGGDIKDMVNAYDKNLSAEQMYEYSTMVTRPYRMLETCGKPVVAAINGAALGGGLELCLACHYRIATDNPETLLGCPEVSIGLIPGGGGTQRLPRLIGIEKSLPLLMLGQHLKVDKALALGIIDEVVSAGELLDKAREYLLSNKADAVQPWDKKGYRVPGGAGLLNQKMTQTFMGSTALTAEKTSHNYPAPIALLSAVFEGTIVPVDTGLRIESKYFASLLLDPVARNLMRTLFVNKGLADKLDRRPTGVEKSTVQKLGVLGAGMMGSAVAYVSAKSGMDVVLLDSKEDIAEKGKDYSRKLLQKALERGKSTAEKNQQILDRIHATSDYANLQNCDLIIENVFEDRDIKAIVTQKAVEQLNGTTLFASNTSSLPITGLASAYPHQDKFIGIHFFSPVDKMPLVEIIVGEKTSNETIARALDYVKQLRKTPIVVNDSRGFYTSRVFGIYVNEGVSMLQEGIASALIENAAKLAGMAVGPLTVADEVTLELCQKVYKQTKEDEGESYVPLSGERVIYKFCDELDRKGRRYGKGFYDYPEEGGKHLWQGIKELYPLREDQPSPEEVQKRFLHIQALETARCMEEGVLTHPADGDLGSIFGWGFPSYTGGTLSYIDTIGIKNFVDDCDAMATAYGPRFEVSDWLRERANNNMCFYPIET